MSEFAFELLDFVAGEAIKDAAGALLERLFHRDADDHISEKLDSIKSELDSISGQLDLLSELVIAIDGAIDVKTAFNRVLNLRSNISESIVVRPSPTFSLRPAADLYSRRIISRDCGITSIKSARARLCGMPSRT